MTDWTLTVPALADWTVTLEVQHSDITIKHPVPQGKFRVLGRQNMVTRKGTPGGIEIELGVRVKTTVAYEDLMTALKSGYQMVLATPWGATWNVDCGDITESLVANASIGDEPLRLITIPFTECDVET